MNTIRLTQCGVSPQWMQKLPKAELHMHIEGSLEPELIFALAQRNAVPLAYPSVEALRAAYAFTDLQSFLNIYYAGASVLLTETDFYDMAMAYFERASADGVVHTEIFFDPQTHTQRGVAISVQIAGLKRAQQDAKEKWGLEALLIMCFLRHLSEEEAFTTLQEAEPHLQDLVAVGLDSSEVGNPPAKFERVFARARELGLRVVAHAGEEGAPSYIWDALRLLQVERVDHGVQAKQDAVLMEYLREIRMPLTVCPLSNLKLCVVPDMASHPLKLLLDAGLCVTINSDDPAYFGGYMQANWLACFEALPLDKTDAYQLAQNSFEASFASPQRKQNYLALLEDYFKASL